MVLGRTLQRLILGLVLIFPFGSCSHYLDKATGTSFKDAQGSISYYPDSNVMTYSSNIGLKADGEILNPRHFVAILPKGLLYGEEDNSMSFGFYYSKNQVIAIHIILSDNYPKGSDSAFVPSSMQIDDFKDLSQLDSDHKHHLRKMEDRSSRKQLIIRKGPATILLYNILPQNLDKFTRCMQQFRFL
jgi:hypothetical protein